MFRAVSAFAIIISALFAISLFTASSDEFQNSKPMADSQEANSLPQKVKNIPVDKIFTFSGEKVPIANFDVYERLDRELLRNTYFHSNTILILKRSRRYFPVIEKILAENGVPDDFKYLAVAESNLGNAVSPSGAKGVWQFLQATGKSFDLEINDEVDERFHLEKSTEAACSYLKSMKEKFGSWTMAAAAYNMGETKLSKEISAQRTDNYYDLNLGQETSAYVFRILAFKEILCHSADYGFLLEEVEKYAPLNNFKTVRVDSNIENLGDFAIKHETTYRMLKVYNPWLLTASLSNENKKTYEIRIPKK